MENNKLIKNFIYFTRKFMGETLRVIIEVPEGISEKDKYYYAMDMLKELKTIAVKKPLNRDPVDVEVVEYGGDKKTLTINITTELYDALYDLTQEEGLCLDVLCEHVLRFGLTHTCGQEPYLH